MRGLSAPSPPCPRVRGAEPGAGPGAPGGRAAPPPAAPAISSEPPPHLSRSPHPPCKVSPRRWAPGSPSAAVALRGRPSASPAGPGRAQAASPVPRRPLPAGGRAAADAGSRGQPGARAAPGRAGRELRAPLPWSPYGARPGEGPAGRSQPPPRAAPSRPQSGSSREDGCARTRSESSLSRLPASRPVPSRSGVPGPQSLRPGFRLGAFLGFPRCLRLPVSLTASRSSSLRSQLVQPWVSLPFQSLFLSPSIGFFLPGLPVLFPQVSVFPFFRSPCSLSQVSMFPLPESPCSFSPGLPVPSPRASVPPCLCSSLLRCLSAWCL